MTFKNHCVHRQLSLSTADNTTNESINSQELRVIFAHVKGIQKEVNEYKSEDSLGLTITDNGTGYAFRKRIKDGSLIDPVKMICVGEHIESITGENILGQHHCDVAKKLKELKKS